MAAAAERISLRRRTYEVLDVGSSHDPLSRLVHRFLIAVVLASVAAVILESVPHLSGEHGSLFMAIEISALAIFTVEYGLRLWAAVEHRPHSKLPPWRARLLYALQPAAVVDLLAILPFYLVLFVPADDLRVLVVFRLIRFFKLARYSPGMRSLLDAIHAERRALAACLVILGGLMLVGATAMHVAEREAQPDKLGTIPDAMYWALITLTTVGYGDVAPVTASGKVIAGVTAVFGLVMVALPIGIIATAFTEVIHKRDFVVTWGMVARVPLFSSLDASEIAEIMRFLHSQTVESGEVIVRRDERADSMYFVASGEVEVELPGRILRLSVGQFFGEIAILRTGRRTATVRAITACKLLVLDAFDFQILMDRKPHIAQRVRDIAASRVAPEPVEPKGDIAETEIGIARDDPSG